LFADIALSSGVKNFLKDLEKKTGRLMLQERCGYAIQGQRAGGQPGN